MKSLCPIHEEKLSLSKQWKPPDGLDPKMLRYACMQCTEYWYKAPKRCLMRDKIVQLEFGVKP